MKITLGHKKNIVRTDCMFGLETNETFYFTDEIRKYT